MTLHGQKTDDFFADYIRRFLLGNKQIFTQPEMKNDKVYTVLELIERHNGYQGFLPPQADGLMESTRL